MLGSARADAILNPFFFHHHHLPQAASSSSCFEASAPKEGIVGGIWEFDHQNHQEQVQNIHPQEENHRRHLEPTSVLDLWSPSPSSRGAGSGLSLGGGGIRHSHGGAASTGRGGAADGSPCSYDDNHSNTSVGDGGRGSHSSGSSSSRNVDHRQNIQVVQQVVHPQNHPLGGQNIQAAPVRDRSLDEWIFDLQQQQQGGQGGGGGGGNIPQQQFEELESLLLKCPSSPVPQEPHAFAKWFLNEQVQQQQQQMFSLPPAKEECLMEDSSSPFEYSSRGGGGGVGSGGFASPIPSVLPSKPPEPTAFRQQQQQQPSFQQQFQIYNTNAPTPGFEYPPQNLQLGAGQVRKLNPASQFGHHLGGVRHAAYGEGQATWGNKRRFEESMHFHQGEDPMLGLDNSWANTSVSGGIRPPLLLHSPGPSGTSTPLFGNTLWSPNNKEMNHPGSSFAMAVPLVASEACFPSSSSRKLQRVHAHRNPVEQHHEQDHPGMFSSMFGGSSSSPPPPPVPNNVHQVPNMPTPAPGISTSSNNNNNNNNSVPDEGLGLMDQLVRLAQAIDGGSMQDAQSILARLNQHLFCHQGKRIQRLSFYFKEALAARLKNRTSLENNNENFELEESSSGTGTTGTTTTTTGGGARNKKLDSPLEFFHKVKAYMSFCEVSPLLKFAYLTANQAILEAAAANGGATTLHIVDYDPGFGSQWASLLQDVANQRGTTTTRLRFTMVGPDETRLRFVVESLQDFARGLNMVPIPEVKLLVCNGPEGLCPAALNVIEGETIAVNFMFSLHRALAYSGGVNEVVTAAVGLSPAVVTLAEQEVDDNGAKFQKRFVEALQYYAFVMDSLGPDDGAEVLAVERELLAPDIANAVSTEGKRRVERHERLAQWRNRMVSSGLQAWPISEAAKMQAEYLIKTAPSRNFEVKKDEAAGGLLLEWQGKPLVAVSAWTVASGSSQSASVSLHIQQAQQDAAAAAAGGAANKNTC